MSTDCVAFLDRPEKSGNCKRPGSAAQARAGSYRSAHTKMMDRNCMTVSKGKFDHWCPLTSSGVWIFLASDSRADDVDVLAGDAQCFQELSSGLIRAFDIERVLPQLEEAYARDEAGGQRRRQPAGVEYAAPQGVQVSRERRRHLARIEARQDPGGEVLAGRLRPQGAMQRFLEFVSHDCLPRKSAAGVRRSRRV